MRIEAGQIYYAKNAVLGKATYARPILILRVSNGNALVTPFSTQLELFQLGDLKIDVSAPEYPLTGLKKESYLMNGREFRVSLDFLKDARYLGFISGSIKKSVEVWWGEELK